jgi:Ala-tRNA(Pro) deacylase
LEHTEEKDDGILEQIDEKYDRTLKLTEGRPKETAGRLDKEIRVYDFLDSLGVPYQRIDHEPLMTMAACEEVDKILCATICKNLFLCNRQETDFYLLMMPGEKKFKTKDLAAQIGTARLSFAKEEYMEEFLDITPGSVSVMGLMNDKEKRVQLLMDEDILKGEYIGCHPCINTTSLRIHTKDMMERVIPALEHRPCMVKL